MPLQNRVTPAAELITVAARGTLMGNRGVLHNAQKEIVRNWKTKAWISCQLQFRGRYRRVFTPNRWTELFFLDEATALAAGHRPCGECRYQDFKRFKSLWLSANPGQVSSLSPKIGEIDAILHRERLNSEGTKRVFSERLSRLPDGVFVKEAGAGEMYLLLNGVLLQWSPAGYKTRKAITKDQKVEVLTPASIVRTIEAGYKPLLHPTIATFFR